MKLVTSTEALDKYFKDFATPHDLAWLIDELIHEHYQVTIRLLQLEEEGGYPLHSDAHDSFYLLKEFRDALLKCQEEEVAGH